MKLFGRFPLFLLFLVSAVAKLHAQDLRSAKEPVVPPTCIVLKAALANPSASSGEIEVRADRSGSDQSGLDTVRLQAAIDHCDKGKAVELSPDGQNTAFLASPISLRAGVTLLIDKGVTLYGSRNPESYALTPGSCGVVNDSTSGCKPLITVKSASSSGIMGDGVIDGQGGSKIVIDGKISAKSWWDLGEDAHTAGHQQAPRMVETNLSDDFTLYRITLRNSPNSHLLFRRGEGLTVWGVKIDTPKAARNTDGISAIQSRNITIAESFIRTGEDHIALQSADGPTSNVTIVRNHLYWGRGLTIGGETAGGISQVRVQDLSLDGPDNGLRIRSNPTHGGLVEDLFYDDICIRDAKYPIVFDTTFSFPGKGAPAVPVYQNITLRNIRLSGGGRIQFNGFDDTHRIGVTLDGVFALDRPNLYRAQTIHTDITFGFGPVNLIFTGDDSTVSGKQSKGSLTTCTQKFVPFP